MKDIIIKAVESNYLLEIEDKILGFLNQTPRLMLDHLCNRGGALDFADTKILLAKRDQEWDASEVPTLYFNRVEKTMRQSAQVGIQSDLNEQINTFSSPLMGPYALTPHSLLQIYIKNTNRHRN